MLTASFNTSTGKGMLVGLDEENMKRLLDHKPIIIERPRLPEGRLEFIMVIGGKQLSTMMKDNGLGEFITPETQVVDKDDLLKRNKYGNHGTDEGSRAT